MLGVLRHFVWFPQDKEKEAASKAASRATAAPKLRAMPAGRSRDNEVGEVHDEATVPRRRVRRDT